MKKLFLLIQLLAVYTTLLSQAVGINTDGSVPHPSSILDIKSSTKGLLIPRTSTSSRLSILNGANGLMLYDTTIGSFWFQNAGLWIESGRIDVDNNNAFFGYQSGKAIPVGDFNAGFGTEALFSNTNGTGNSALGQGSLHSNTTGDYNTAVGMFTLYFNNTGSRNTAIGNDAMILNQTGYSNVAIGNKAGFSNIEGSYNTFLGDSSGYSNTTGDANTYAGNYSGLMNTTGTANAFFGANTGYSGNGSRNSFFGLSAGGGTTGSDNCFIGYQAGNFNSTGNYLTMLGAISSASTDNLFYATAVGYHARVACSNCLVLGGTTALGYQTKVGINNSSPATDLHIIQQTDANGDNTRGIRLQRPSGNQWRVFLDPLNNYIFQYNNNVFAYIEPVSGNYINSSDTRLKKDIYSLDRVLDKLLLLQPKTYHYIASSDANHTSWGFLAQDVEKLFPDFVFSSENGMKGIAYSNFSVIAVKAIQEQQQIIDEQKQKLDMQQQQIAEILKELSYLRKKIEQ